MSTKIKRTSTKINRTTVTTTKVLKKKCKKGETVNSFTGRKIKKGGFTDRKIRKAMGYK